MDILNIIKDSLKYPISDMKQFLTLAIPNMILAVIFIGVFLVLFMLGVNFSIPESLETFLSNDFTVALTIMVILPFILAFALINDGIAVSVIRKTIGESNHLPEFDPGFFLIGGTKALIVELVVYVIPLFVLGVLFALAIALESSVFMLIMIVLLIIVLILLGLILPISLARLAETDDIGEALSIGRIWEIAKSIGLGNIFRILVIVAIITRIMSFVSELLLEIPIIGLIISMGLIDTYISLFSARANGLLYIDRYYRNQFTNNPYQEYPPSQGQYQQYPNTQNQYQQYPPSQGQYWHDNLISNNTQQLDFNPDNVVDNEPVHNQSVDNNAIALQDETPVQDDETSNQVPPQGAMKRCSHCGHENLDFVVVCMKCGKEL